MPRRLDGERGTTVVEFTVASALLMVVLTLASTILVGMQREVSIADSRTRTNDQLRLAVESIDRQLRSGNVIHDPETESGMTPGMSLRIYTQANATTAAAVNRCVQWRLEGDQLQTREWVDDWRATNGYVSGWRTVADGVQNQATGSEAFSFDRQQAGFGDRIVRVQFIVNHDARNGGDQTVEASITGRNVQFGYPIAVCDDIPS